MTSVRGRHEFTVLLGCLLLQCFHLCLAQQAASVVDEPKNGSYHGRMTPVPAHATWLERDGAPANITAIAQTADGFLWLGTPSGLFRFDGAQFASYPVSTLSEPLPSNLISALLSDRAGGLWIGYHGGGISHLQATGVVVNYSPASGHAPNSAQKFAYGADGKLWAIADFHLYRLEGDRWENFGRAHGLPDDPLFMLFVDRSGKLWASTRGHLFYLTPGGTAFVPYLTQTSIVVDMVEMPNGEMWICDGWKTVRPLNTSSNNKGWAVNGYVRLAIEEDGSLWLAQDYRGVTHVTGPGTRPELIKEQALTSEQTTSIFKDHDDNIWVGTSRGLDRFHSTQVQRVSNTRVEYYPALCAPPKGGVWIATLARPLVYARENVLKPFGKDVGSAPIVCPEDGSVWMVDPITNKLTGLVNGTMIRVDIPPNIHLASGTSIGLDRDGSLLIAFRTYGLWRFDGTWRQVVDPGLPADEPLSIFRDARARVWLGYAGGAIGLRDQAGSETFRPSRAANLGNVLAFAEIDGAILAAGTNGIAILEGKDFRKVSLVRDGVLRGVSGMVQDHEGNLWLNTAAGLYRVRRNQLRSHLNSGVEYDRFDDRQGVQGTATQERPLPSLVLDKLGSLWVATSGAVLEIDPVKIAPRHRPPLLIIVNVIYNGQLIADREHQLGLVTFTGRKLKELEIDYAGIDLSAPERIRYRLMMEGKDTTWQEVGERRQAFYDHLSPGKYRFRVADSDDIGRWTELSAPLYIEVRPTFYETAWFRFIAILAFVGLLYLAYSIRVHILTNALRAKLQERANERLRIARELHDTLLQSLHGLMLRFHFATSELPENEPAREPLQLALQRADMAFLEARQRIESLREEVPDEPHFNQQLFQMAQGLDIQSRLEFIVKEEGEPRVIVGQVQTELCRIAREALVNTLNHANATRASINLIYLPSELRMCCSDNGIGIPAEIRRSGRRAGHWGLVGIAERAATIDGRLEILDAKDGGTDIEVRVSGRMAYRGTGDWFRRLLTALPSRK